MRAIPLAVAPQDYEHPRDRALGRALQQNRLYRSLTRKAGPQINAQVAAICLGPLLSQSVEVTPQQFPHIHALFAEMVAIVDIKPMPRLFLHGGALPQASTIGIGSQAYVGISSALARELDDAGLSFVLGHELGHIRSEHSRITTVAALIAEESRRNPFAEDQSFAEAYLEWSRVAEITADRAGLLACQDEQVACRTLLTILLGSRSMALEVNLDEYLIVQSGQIELNAEALLFQRQNEHPLIPFRMRELIEFSRSSSYKHLISHAMLLGERINTQMVWSEDTAAIEDIDIELG